jgi:acyl-CoA dehydrogenase
MGDRSYLEWPFLDDEHRSLAVEVEGFCATQVSPAAVHGESEAEVDATVRGHVRRLGEAGLLGHCVPAPHGGSQEKLSTRALCVCREHLAHADGLADFAFAMQGLGSAPISLFGADELKARYLPGVAAGKRIAAFGLSEPDAGSDVGAMSTAARREGAHWILDGTKTWISNAGLADQYVIFARTGEAPGARGLSAFVVEADNPGLTVAERIDLCAPHPIGTLALEGCRVPENHTLAAPGEGFKVAMSTLDVFRATVGAAALGFARRALDEALSRVRDRRVFGKVLAEFQLTQARLADMAVAIDAAALLVYRAAWVRDVQGRRVTREASMAKLQATESAQLVIDSAVQLFGGLGVVRGNAVEKLYREIRALRIYEGTSEIQKLVIARQVLEQGGP